MPVERAGLTYVEFLLDNTPIKENCTYTATFDAFDKLIKEEWKRIDTTLLKSIDYAYTGVQVTQDVRKVFGPNGVAILAQITWDYSYTGLLLTSATMTKNV